jgi:hypothetical protein
MPHLPNVEAVVLDLGKLSDYCLNSAHPRGRHLERDVHGVRWRADVKLTRQNRQAVVRTVWMFRAGELFPRFVTCWVL